MVDLIHRIIEEHHEVDFFEIRFYGGWYREQELTRAGSLVMTEHFSMNLFPIIKDGKVVRGEQKLVASINGINHIWYNTYRERSGLPRIIINHEAKGEFCNSNKSLCPIHIIEKFSKSGRRVCSVEGCATNNSQAIMQMGQKMVDAMMVCDIVSYSQEEDVCELCVLTDDVDLFPAFAVCRNNNQSLDIQLGIINGQNIVQYTDYLRPFSINVFQFYDRLRA